MQRRAWDLVVCKIWLFMNQPLEEMLIESRKIGQKRSKMDAGCFSFFKKDFFLE
jgi:hypothetical protein